MALQARQLERRLGGDGHKVTLFAANFALPGPLGLVPGLRTLARWLLIGPKLWVAVRGADVVHVLAASWLYFFAVVWPAAVVARLAGRRLVVNYRGGEAARFFASWGWAAGPVFRLATVVTAPSEFLAEVIRSRFGVPVDIVPNIVDLSAFRYRARRTVTPRLIVTRHLEPMYDVESVLRAFRRIAERYPEARLWVAGTGSEGERLRRLASEWNLQGVEFLGHVPQAELPARLDQCDILINASIVDNFPGALVEASGAGLLVVSTGAGGIPFIYQNGKNALLVEPGDWEGLAKAVEMAVENPDLAERLMSAGAATARACDWQEMCKFLYHAYGFEAREEFRPTCAGTAAQGG